jgi:exopolyphosphatase/guanosine-5'-triphosphate,3'-diphosphate pyrophosphatase
MPSAPVAVIDIGSNSIKALIAARDEAGNLQALKTESIDARISAGISQLVPSLTEDGMERGLDAVRLLLNTVAEFQPVNTVLVATSAVRDASNGSVFCARVRHDTGHSIRILSGDEEANLIGHGLTADPALRGLHDFYVFDLGGGSLECLAFRDRTIHDAASLRLGCVRLTEKFVADLSAPLPQAILQQVDDYTREVLCAPDGFAFSLPSNSVAVGTGGTLTTVRAILGAREMKGFLETDPIISVADLRQLLGVLAEMPLARRQQISGLPRARADVFPVALATLIAVAGVGGLEAYHHSTYNLRWGIAAQLLESQ